MGRKTEILKIKGDWVEAASDCRSTVGKPPLDHEPSACAASPHRRRGSMPRTLRRRCMRPSRKLRMCFVRAAYIAGDVRKCIRVERTRVTLMC